MNEGKHSWNISRPMQMSCNWISFKFPIFLVSTDFFFHLRTHTRRFRWIQLPRRMSRVTWASRNVIGSIGSSSPTGGTCEYFSISWIWRFGSFPADGFIAAGIIRHGGWCARRCSAISNADVSLSFFSRVQRGGAFLNGGQMIFFFF